MATISDIIDDIKMQFPEKGISRSRITRHLNDGMMNIASEFKLPGLLVVGYSVTALPAQYSVPLPSDFHQHLFSAEVGGNQIEVAKSVRTLMSVVGLSTTVGSINTVAQQDGLLYYQKVPSSNTTIKVSYYRKPSLIVDSDSVPDGANSEALSEAIMHWAFVKLYTIFEQAEVSNKGNTLYHTEKLKGAMESLSNYCSREAFPDFSTEKASPSSFFV